MKNQQEQSLKAKNAELEKQLAEKNRDLEIEAALERVRTAAMAMAKPDDLLAICKLTYVELRALGFKAIRNSQIFIFDDPQGAFINYGFSDDEGANIAEIFYDSHPRVREFITTVRKTSDAFAELSITGDELIAWRQYRIDNGEPDDFRLGNIDTLYYYFYSIGIGAIGISNFEALSEGQRQILKRFRNVFDLAYRRYADIQLAAAQAREAQIELALERVRAVAMGMRKPGDLLGICRALFAELQQLDFNDLRNAIIHTYLNVNYLIDYDYSDFTQGHISHIPYSDNPIAKKYAKDIRKTRDAFAELIITGSKLKEWKVFMDANNEAPDERLGSATSLYYYIYAVGDASIGISTFSPIHAEKLDVLKRFRNVFDLAYSRFMDITKAEAQAREAQIELALERVRTVAMSMRVADDLLNICQVLFEEFKVLGFGDLRNAMINILHDDKGYFLDYDFNDSGASVTPFLYNSHPMMERQVELTRSASDAFIEHALTGDELEDFKAFRERNGEPADPKLENISGLYYYFYSIGIGSLGISTFSALTDEKLEVLKRFRNVFDLAYRRYADIQLAEAQAKEARIQTALERVRAAAMAMKKPNEVLSVCEVMYKELILLGINNIRNAQIAVQSQAKQSYLICAYSDTDTAALQETRYSSSPVVREVLEELRRSKDAFYQREFTGEKFEEWRKWRESISPLKDIREKEANSLCFYLYSFGPGHLGISTYNPISDEQIELIKRFKNVFQLSYQRYADVAQAEEQAREAQIEAALERVRSRSMGMQKSDELKDVIQIVFDQFVHLNIHIDHTGFVVDYKPGDDWHFWIADHIGSPNKLTVTHFESVWGDDFDNAKKSGADFFVTYLDLDAKNKFYRDMFEHLPDMPQEYRDNIFSKAGLAVSTVLMEDVALYIENFSLIPYTDEENAILMRFGAVFQQSYTRFLDLQKAEAQAREGQIQLGLERVRAKAMSMQTSEELNELIGTVFDELTKLDFVLTRCLIMIFDPETKASRWWMANSEAPADPMNYLVQNHKNPAYDAYLKAWKERNLKWNYTLKGKVKRDWDDFLFVDTELARLPGPVIAGMKAPKQVLLSASFNNFGCLTLVTVEPLSDEHSEIMLRFANVFDMCYTRFNDLKQAEEQARESQIQLALERVRARTMAMQKSEELHEVIQLIYDQLHQLNFNLDTANFTLNYHETSDFDLWIAVAGARYATKIRIPYFDHPVFVRFNEAKTKGGLFVDFLTLEEKNSFFEHFFKYAPEVIAERKALVLDHPGFARSVAFMKNVALSIVNYRGIPYSETENNTLLRFGQVFDQTYTRFNDLKQAEEQAREAQVELSLERIRAKTMAMHTSEHVGETVATMFDELVKLGIEKTVRCGILIIDETKHMEVWTAAYDADGKVKMQIGRIDMMVHPLISNIHEAWKNKEQVRTYELAGTDLKAYYKAINDSPDYPMQFDLAALPEKQTNNAFFFPEGAIFAFTLEPLAENEVKLFKRFAGVFGLTYRRFLDLQKAEAQAKEAQIQLALERVRARTMAMQKSDELAETVSVLFKQLLGLGIPTDQIRTCGIVTFDANEPNGEQWITEMNGDIIPRSFMVPYDEAPAYKTIYQWWKNGKEFVVNHLEGAALQEHLGYLTKYTKVPLSVLTEDSYDIYNHTLFFTQGYLFIITRSAMTEYHDVFKRFGSVFQQSYTRFLDLQKAEAQAREAQVEAALERVRSRTMAMFKSDELAETASVLFQQFDALGISLDRIFIGTFLEESQEIECWVTDQGGNRISNRFVGSLNQPEFGKMYKAFKAGKKSLTLVQTGKQLDEYIHYLRDQLGVAFKPEQLHHKRVQNLAFFSKGLIGVSTDEEQPREMTNLVERFASVFNLTYTRFLDLQKAEAQAREAKIEASLERVRGKAMAMRNSNDLSVTASMVFAELRVRGINPIRSGVGLVNRETRKAKIYSNTSTQTATDLALMGEVSLSGHPVFEQQYEAWLNQQNYYVALGGEELASYYKILSAGLKTNLGIAVKKNQKEYGHWFMFSEGFLYAWSDQLYTEAEIRILERFKNVIELTFRRYIELQKSEASARDAIREASLDRVRAEIASMRSTQDLERITPLVWNELTILGIPFIRCGIFIADEVAEVFHSHLSTPDGKALAAFDLNFYSGDIGGILLPAWRNKQIGTNHWSAEEFAAFTTDLVDRGAVKSQEKYVTEHPDTSLDLHFLPFLQGMLYVGNTAPLSPGEIELVQSLADAFSTAYARYEDFNKLEVAKKQVENTLADLKAAQTKLIQSEKMASLGELTAGIAHEIQNPLNFVNNFSEVNQEMLEELKTECEKPKEERDQQLELDLIRDLIDNEQKINHHGKRADAIVKGMLQHSRTGGGEKQPTNINTLADEFMRLSYHGLRAKDKVFNAELVTHFDPDLPKVSVIGQDMGRVLLNLFNNAFYAVNQKKKTHNGDYTPEVTVTTLAENGQVIIKVKDNGVGMPEHIKEKIMQPFFTTKPTGEGTGLGLSLTYDMVVKGHGGTIQVNSKEGEGSEFIIQLPIH